MPRLGAGDAGRATGSATLGRRAGPPACYCSDVRFPPACTRADATGVPMSDGSLTIAARSYAAVMALAPAPLAARCAAMAARIPEAALAGPGREAMPHVTVRWGLDDAAAPAIRAALAGWPGPARARLGRTSAWPTPDGDCVKLDVLSPDLAELRQLIELACPEAATTFPFDPHLTLAYVESGRGAEFAGWDDLAGVIVEFTELVIGLTDDNQEVVPLGSRIVGASGFDPNQPRDEDGRWTETDTLTKLDGFLIPSRSWMLSAYFHGTASEALASIKEHGLVPAGGRGGDAWARENGWYRFGDRTAAVYLAADSKTAKQYATYAVEANPGSAPVLLAIKVPSTAKSRIASDEFENQGYRFDGTIPPDWIRVIGADGSMRALGEGAEDVTLYAVLITKEEPVSFVGAEFDPNQPRDENGRWTDGSGAVIVDKRVSPEEGKAFLSAVDALPDKVKRGLKSKIIQLVPSVEEFGHAHSAGEVFGATGDAGILVKAHPGAKTVLYHEIGHGETKQLARRPAFLEAFGRDTQKAHRGQLGYYASSPEEAYAQSFAYHMGGDDENRTKFEKAFKNTHATLGAHLTKMGKASVRGLADGDLPSRYRLSKFAAEHAAELVQAPRRVRTLIRNEVRKALRNGEGPEGIADRLDGLVAMEPGRIDTIARTEYAIARTGARLEEAATLYGDVEVVKGWVLGDESCPRCIALAGMEVPIDEDFVADDGERVAGPPLHPNCDCDIEIREVAERERLRAAVRLVGAEWDESKHPRVPAGDPEGGQFTSAGRDYTDTDLRKRIEQAHFSLLANGVFSGRDDVRVDLSTMKPADRLAALQVARSEINLFYSKERYGSRMAAYDAFLKKYAADPEGGLADGLASGLITREKAGEFTYSVASSFPYRNVLDGLDAAGRDEFERGLVEVLKTGSTPFDASAHDLSRAGWTHAELERFADRVQAAGGTFPKWTSENKYPAIHKLAGDLAFFTRDYESFRMEAFSGWASVHGSDTAVTLRAAAEEAFPSTNGTTFYRVSAIRGEQGVEKLYSQRAVENIRKLKAETESFYLSKFKGKDPAGKPLEVYRGVGGHIEAYAPGSIESWTRDSRTVKRFGLMMSDDRTGNQYSALRTKVTYNDVLWSYESAAGKPGWPEEEVLKGKKEFVLIGQRLREVESEKREGK